MKTLPPALVSHVAGGLTTLCRCWRINRRDGVVMGFTDGDRDLAFDLVTYKAATGFAATAIEGQLGLAVSNLDVEGALSSAAITEDDLAAGRYDDAEVTVFLVNWADPSQRATIRTGHIGQVTRGKLAFTAELRGLAAKLDQPAGRIFQRSCAWDLGDARCGVDINTAGRRGAGTVSQVIDAFEFVATGLGGIASNALARGRLVWTNGSNTGLSADIAAHTLSGSHRIVISLPMGTAVVVGDSFNAFAGCDRTFSTCRNRFDNAVNFGGFPTCRATTSPSPIPSGATAMTEEGCDDNCHAHCRRSAFLDRHALPSPGGAQGCRLRLPRSGARRLARNLRRRSRTATGLLARLGGSPRARNLSRGSQPSHAPCHHRTNGAWRSAALCTR
jgi:uncharacterized phage protein (TIGR02218 family)